MADLSLIFITANEHPPHWKEFHRQKLLEAAEDFPIIAVSRTYSTIGTINLLDEEPKSLSNIYFQMLRAARVATTEFVAIAESDCLYHKSHFTFYRPKPDEFAYDMNRFSLFTWGTPTYSWRNRKSNCSLIAPTALLIETLEERFKKWPQGTPDALTGEVGRCEERLGLTPRKSIEVFNNISIIMVNHENGSEERQKTHRKSLGPIRAYSLPFWCESSTLVREYR